jgi:uncharacterized repeat protein (TIGR03803 family)
MKTRTCIRLVFSQITLILCLNVAVTLKAIDETKAADRQALHGIVPPAIKELGLQPLARLPATNRLHLVIGLPWRNQDALIRLLNDLYDPSSPGFRQYLAPEQFTESFGPTKDDYQALIEFASSNHLVVTATSPNRMLLDVSATVAEVEQALGITLNTYQHPTESRTFYAPAGEPSVALSLPVLYIGGLDNYILPHPLFKARPTQPADTGVPYTGSGPGGGYLARDLRNAYAANVSFTGTGQKVGLFELDGYYAHDILAYEALAGLPSVTLSNVLLDGFNGSPGGANVEVALDIDMAIAMAPGLAEVIIYEGNNPDDVLNRMANDNLAKQMSSSWGWSPLDPIAVQDFQQFAAQGQSMYQASGDSDAYVGPVFPPSDNPYLTVVGGTTLTMTANGGAYVSETVWNAGNGVGSGGGISTTYSIPIWQQGMDMSENLGSTTKRNLPDVAMPADNIFIFANNGQQLIVGGTSCAAPLWAGFTALINQAALANNEPLVGFINPAVYALCRSGAYAANFHDTTVGNNFSPSSPTRFPAVPGYDLCTGWGTPIGSNLIYSLGVPEPLHISPVGDTVFVGPQGGPLTPGALYYSLTNKSGGSLTWELVQSAPWLTVGPTNGTLTGGGPAVTVTVQPTPVATNLGPGVYTATLAFTNLTTQFGQLRQVTLALATPSEISSQPTDQAVLQGMAAAFHVAAKGYGLLTYQWQQISGTNVINLQDGANISGTATDTLTISNVSPANVAAYSVTVSNIAGIATSDSASLSIIASAPVIVLQPAPQSVLPGGTASFAVGAVGTQPTIYRWLLNGTNLSDGGYIHGSRTSTLSLSNVTTALVGTYSVLLSNTLGAVTSSNAPLSLIRVTAPGVILDAMYSFAGTTFGFNPYAGLLQARDGNFYGTALLGGAPGNGTVFKMTPGGSVSLLHAFNGGLDGANPYGGLVQATNGLLYGTTFDGGIYYYGSVFRMTTNGALSTAVSFNYTNNGAYPVAGLAQARDGGFYGLSLEGGLSGYGTVYRITPGGLFVLLSSFNYENGAYPSSVFVAAADGNLYGTAENGGTNAGWGTMFRVGSAGTITPLFSFAGDNGGIPTAGMVQDSDGALYGVTNDGGTNGSGTVFKRGTDGAVTSLYSFSGGPDGANPFGGLVLASDGNLYGTTMNGGAYGFGTVFLISPGGTLVTLAQLDGFQGANPAGNLVQANDNNFYGTTVNGGLGNEGAIFRLTVNGPLQITRQPVSQSAFLGDTAMFSVASFGTLPVGYQWLKNGTNMADGGTVAGANSRTLTISNLTLADDADYLVVLTNNYGAVTSTLAHLSLVVSPPYIIAEPQSQTVLAGANVSLSVQAGGDGPLYFQWQMDGTNLVNGGNVSGATTPALTLTSVTALNAGTYAVTVTNALGSVSSTSALLAVAPVVSQSGAYSLFHSFAGGNLGMNPYSGLFQARDGFLYGTTVSGGSGGYGIIYRVTTGIFAIAHAFTNGVDGAYPYAGLVQATDGNLYGDTSQGGAYYSGSVFKLTPGAVLTPLYSFNGGDDGSAPVASLVQGRDGKLYGTAFQGGSDSYGAVFAVATNGIFTPFAAFTQTNGANPAAQLILARDGNFYGTTETGGSNNFGTAFRLGTNGSITTLHSFGGNDGAYPLAGLIQANDGAFYGTSATGGSNGWGTVFRLTWDGGLTNLHSFIYADGAQPIGGLIQATDGNLYGTTSEGGLGGEGTVFQITTNGALTTLLWFNGVYGANPQSSLVQARDGSFYGTTEYGGTAYNGASGTGNGLVFRLTLPMFLSNPFTQAVATVGVPYAGSLGTNVVQPPTSVLTFAKTGGPAWLSVGADGTLSGVPGIADLGLNTFTVTLLDPNAWSSAATMQILVVTSPVITLAIARQGANLVLTWNGATGPYTVQMTTSLDTPVWQTVAGPTLGTSLLLSPSNGAAFYRVQGQSQ